MSTLADSDRRRFDRLYEQNFDRVAAYLLARSDRESAADALARTFEIAWRRLPDVPAQPLPWLLGVARRVLSEGRRAQTRREALVERLAAQRPRGAAEDHGEMLSRREHLLAALAELTVPQQEAMLLIAWDGLSEREAAQVLGCSRGALALRVHRARRQLRRTLRDTSEVAVAKQPDDVRGRPAVQVPAKEAL